MCTKFLSNVHPITPLLPSSTLLSKQNDTYPTREKNLLESIYTALHSISVAVNWLPKNGIKNTHKYCVGFLNHIMATKKKFVVQTVCALGPCWLTHSDGEWKSMQRIYIAYTPSKSTEYDELAGISKLF